MDQLCLPRKPSRWVNVVTTAAVGALTALTIVGRMSDPAHDQWLVLDIVDGLVAAALIPTVFRWPVQGALALAVLAAFSPAATPPSTVGTLTVALRRPF